MNITKHQYKAINTDPFNYIQTISKSNKYLVLFGIWLNQSFKKYITNKNLNNEADSIFFVLEVAFGGNTSNRSN
jgi:hypothetical protein